jgi:hypothetical protein
MTLQELKNIIERISLAHKQIVSFEYGEDFTLATGKGSKYPMVFLEIPYNINYDLPATAFKDLTFALLVLKPSNKDQPVADDHKDISSSEVIGEVLIRRMTSELKPLGLVIQQVSGLSLRRFSNDMVSGFRYDITGRLTRSNCSYNDQFSDL